METARRMSGERTSTSVPQHNSEHQPSSIQLETELPLLMQSLLNIQNGQQRQAVVAAPIHSQQLQTLQASLNAMTQQRQHAHQQQKSSVQIIRLRGLPFAATEPEIEAFLGPIELPKGMRCIHVARHPDLRPTGEAYVQLSSEAEVLTALKKHKTMMGKRYIEVSSNGARSTGKAQQVLFSVSACTVMECSSSRLYVLDGKPSMQQANVCDICLVAPDAW